MTQELKDRIIKALGGYTAEKFDEEHKAHMEAIRNRDSILGHLYPVIAEVGKNELENLAVALGENLEGWRELLLNCRLGAQVRAVARITDNDALKAARVIVLIEDADDE